MAPAALTHTRSTHGFARRARHAAAAFLVALVAASCVANTDRSLKNYESCETDNECPVSSNCYIVSDALSGTQGPMCTRACATDAECPGGGACLGALTAGTGICCTRCPASNKCNTGFSCQSATEGGTQNLLCMPK